MQKLFSRWTALVALNLTCWGVFGAYQVSQAQSKGGQLPFANSNEQRSDIVREVKEIKDLLKEQNALLREGAAKHGGERR
jgi:hypothetical protein